MPSVKECFEATTCSSCNCWTPYSVRCYQCHAVLPSIDEAFSEEGSIGSKAIAAMQANYGYDWRLAENSASAAFGAALVAVIFMARIGGAFGGI